MHGGSHEPIMYVIISQKIYQNSNQAEISKFKGIKKKKKKR